MELGPSRDRISDLYHRALECTEEERGAFLQKACGSDAALRDELESLLRYEPHSSRFLEIPASVVANNIPGGLDASQMIGRQLGPVHDRRAARRRRHGRGLSRARHQARA